jgi:hypothetical protein
MQLSHLYGIDFSRFSVAIINPPSIQTIKFYLAMRAILVSAVLVIFLVENRPAAENLLALWTSVPCFAVMGRKRFIDCFLLHTTSHRFSPQDKHFCCPATISATHQGQ